MDSDPMKQILTDTEKLYNKRMRIEMILTMFECFPRCMSALSETEEGKAFLKNFIAPP